MPLAHPIPPPLPGLDHVVARFRWLAPPANFSDPAGINKAERYRVDIQQSAQLIPAISFNDLTVSNDDIDAEVPPRVVAYECQIELSF